MADAKKPLRKIICKDLSQKKFEVEVYEGDKVSDMKQRIQQTQGFPAEHLKLIFSGSSRLSRGLGSALTLAGKILADDKLVEDCKIKEKDFLVAMVSKPKATPVAPVPSTSATETPAVTAEAPAPVSEAPVPTTTAAATESTPAPTSDSGSGGNLGFVTGAALENSISQMVEMGFERSQVQRALRAAFNNPDRAVEYLFNGIPAGLDAPPPTSSSAPSGTAAPASAAPAQGATAASAGNTGSRNLFEAAAAQQQTPGAGAQGGQGAANPAQLAELANSPAFQQLRTIVRQNPQMLGPFLQTLAQSNPQMLALINSNQEAFLQALQGDEEIDFGAAMGGGAGGQEGAQYIQVTEEEQAAIGRLCELGFDRNEVIQAYIACDRNEELAASFLLEGAFNDEDEPMPGQG